MTDNNKMEIERNNLGKSRLDRSVSR